MSTKLITQNEVTNKNVFCAVVLFSTWDEEVLGLILNSEISCTPLFPFSSYFLDLCISFIVKKKEVEKLNLKNKEKRLVMNIKNPKYYIHELIIMIK